VQQEQQDKSRIITIPLTDEQRRLIQQEIGQLADTLEFSIEELEERIVPNRYSR
jgi:hypothetical protein